MLPLLLGLLAAVGVARLRAAREYEVAKPSENIRSAPEGRQIGTLLEGARIEEAGRDGKWVKFRLEAWIWGPSLEGYESDRSRPEIATAEERSGSASPAETPREARASLNVHLDEVGDLIDDRFGSFYGMRLDPDLRQVQLRFRVRDLEREALARRQMRVQFEVLDILAEDVEFESLRVETNRPDGSGEVGMELAVTRVEDVRRIHGEDFELWQRTTRRSSDGGQSWTEPE